MRSRRPVRGGTHPEPEAHGDDYKKMCELLATVRRGKGVTQTELAGRLGRDQATIAKLESGARLIDPVELIAILDVLGVDLVQFMTDLRGELHAKPPRSKKGTAKSRRK